MSKLQCKKCGDIIESKYRHDFVWCSCKSIFVDGGKDYFRCGGNPEDMIIISDTEEPFKLDKKKN